MDYNYPVCLFEGEPGLVYGSVSSRMILFGSGGSGATTTYGAGNFSLFSPVPTLHLLLDNRGYQAVCFLLLHKNICCRFSLDEYTQHMFLWRNKKKKKETFFDQKSATSSFALQESMIWAQLFKANDVVS